MKGGGKLVLDVIRHSAISYLVKLALDKVVPCLQTHLGSLLGDERDELEKIKSSLSTIQSVIGSAEERPLKDQALVNWLEKLNDAAYDADDILDWYATQDQRRKVEAQNSYPDRDPVTNKVRKITPSIINSVLNRPKILKLKEIRKRLESLEEERHNFQLSERVQNWEREFKEHRQTHSLVDELGVYGRDKDKEKIIKLLLHPVEGHEDENVPVIPIVGIGGLGKTTLAQLVFNDHRVHNHFELKMWVCVSDDFDVRKLMEKIVRRATDSDSKLPDLDLEELQRRVQKALIEKKFLLVLDDVWNEELEKWNRLRVLLMCGGGASRIVVTTRSLKIASIMSSIEPHHLERLLEEDCWKLFASRAFADRRERYYPKLVEIGKDIVSKCRGVPLAVITLGSLLFDKKDESEWVFVRESEFLNVAQENVHGILPALRLSYYHLNPHLRRCFAFCAIFPKGYSMDKEFLIQLWMAHDCIPSIIGKELEDIGIEILNELLNRSLFQEVKFDYDGDSFSSKIKVHDLVHDLAQSVMGNDCCIIERGESVDISKRVRHLSFHFREIYYDEAPPYANLYEAGSLRTLLMVQFYESAVPQGMAFFKSLRVLDLRFCPKMGQLGQPAPLLPPLPTSLGDWWMHLRYLRLENVENETLPESISSLQNLQTLILCSHRLRELPKGIINLINLRCLDIDRCPSLSHMPAMIGKLSCLRKLPLFIVGDSLSICSNIKELEFLEDLRGKLRIECLEHVSIPSNARQANLTGKPNLQSLELSWFKPYEHGDIILAAADNTLKIKAEEEVLKGLQPHENLKELVIEHYGGIHFAGWMMGLRLPSIVKITLKDCRNCELLPPLGQFRLLKFLHIEHLERVENIGSEDMSEGFPSLETLYVGHMPSLKVWHGLHGEQVFPRLVKFTIESCPMLPTIPCSLYSTPLRSLCIYGCDKLAHLQSELQYLTSLQILVISRCRDLMSLPEGIGNLSSLKELKLKDVGLTSLPESMQELSTLRELCIESCLQLPSLPEGIGNLSSLEVLDLSEVGFTSLPESMQELSTLRRLSIRTCPQLPSLPEWIGNLSSLEVLHLEDVGLTSLPESMQELSTLRKLHIGKCRQLPSLPEWIGNLSSLEVLHLEHVGLTSLPESMQKLSTLEKLSISYCLQLSYLPEWIGNLSSLEELELLIVGLTSLPESMQELSTLRRLGIWLCHQLPSLPEWIGNLSSLESLYFVNIALTSLPESMRELSILRFLDIRICPQLPSLPQWIGDLTALEYLTISCCPEMVSLPVGFQRLTGLQDLCIRNCPELQKRCEETGEDFHKIRHIPNVSLENVSYE